MKEFNFVTQNYRGIYDIPSIKNIDSIFLEEEDREHILKKVDYEDTMKEKVDMPTSWTKYNDHMIKIWPIPNNDYTIKIIYKNGQ